LKPSLKASGVSRYSPEFLFSSLIECLWTNALIYSIFGTSGEHFSRQMEIPALPSAQKHAEAFGRQFIFRHEVDIPHLPDLTV